VGIDLGQITVSFIVLLFSLTVHEAAHAWSASRLGDNTARMLGRVSLNPAVHIDPIGTILFPLIALVTNVPVLGWAKPVPVMVRNLQGNWRQKYMAIAAAGPASNLVIAVAAAALLQLMPVPGEALFGEARDTTSFAVTALRSAVFMNVLLAVFNMVPVPPLDGGNVLSGLLRGPVAETYDRIRPYGFVILYALIFTGVINTVIVPPARFILSLLL